MENRFWQRLPLYVALAFLTNAIISQSTPAFKIKHYNYYKNKLSSPYRAERRIIGGSSPIHYIGPFMPMQPMNNIEQFYAPAMPMAPLPPPSTIYRLPLQMIANGKPHNVMRGFPQKHQQMIEYLPQANSNLIRLPLKYYSNAKPIGVYFKDKSYNYL